MVIGENRYDWCVTYLSVINGVEDRALDKELPLLSWKTFSSSGAGAIVYQEDYFMTN